MKQKDKEELLIGLVDADLMDGGTRHPNLAMLKIAGFLKDNEIAFELITNTDEDITKFTRIYISKVFSFTANPKFYARAIGTENEKKFVVGGTGFYALEKDISIFRKLRDDDLTRLEKDEFLCSFPNRRSGQNKYGINMATQMPYYDLYNSYIEQKIKEGRKPIYFVDYMKYSIGFLTRGCFRHCPFCVNKLENKAVSYSKLQDFLDEERDEKGKLKRPYIYLWDDNFFASPKWEQMLQELIDSGRPFQFRQGLDERLLAQNRRGEDMARMLANSNYHGDFIFAFDNWNDRQLIEKALKIWKKYCPKKETKFYLFCGYNQSPNDDKSFQKDIAEIFMRITILMRYGCLGYIMRHEDYNKAPLSNIYTQIARWCNQPGFFRNLSFWEYCYKNQTYWEEHTLGIKHSRLKTYDEFLEDLNSGYYEDKKICLTLKSVHKFLESHKVHKSLFLRFFNLSFKKMIVPTLWESK